MYKKFQEFLQQIIDGDWEYGDGTPMTQDAKEIAVLLRNYKTRASLNMASPRISELEKELATLR